MGALPINENKKFKYSIYFQSFDEESLEAGSSLESGYEKIESVDTIGDILYLANSVYGIYYPVSFGVWESTEPLTDKDYFEKGIKKYFSLHIHNEDGTDISDEENEFVTFLLSDGRYNSSAFEQYAVGGIVLGAIALGVGALITYFYFKDKKPANSKEYSNPRAKSVVRTINGKERRFPIKDAWKNEHNLENKRERYEVPQSARINKYAGGGDASEHYHEIEYGEGGVARAKDIIMNKIGWNENIADYLVSKSEKFAIWLADSILKKEIEFRNEPKGNVLYALNERAISINTNFINNYYSTEIREILDWLQHPLTPKQELKQLSFDQALEKAREWHEELEVLGGDVDFIEPDTNIILKTYPKNKEGIEYYWSLIPSNFCDLESSRMGHCGRTGYNNQLISLRSIRPYGKGHTINDSHVTIAYGIVDGLFKQIKGKKNNKPAEKYFPYIFDLIKSILDGQINQKLEEIRLKKEDEIKDAIEKIDSLANKLNEEINFSLYSPSSTQLAFLKGERENFMQSRSLSLNPLSYFKNEGFIADNIRLLVRLKDKQLEVRNNRDWDAIESEMDALLKENLDYYRKNIVEKYKEYDKLNKIVNAHRQTTPTLIFNGFGSEYASENDYSFEDMTDEELRELFKINPSIFQDTKIILSLYDKNIISKKELQDKIIMYGLDNYVMQLELYKRGIVSEKPNTKIKLNYSCSEVDRLLDSSGNISLVEGLLCGDFDDEYYDNFSYYFDNPSDLVDNLDDENSKRIIDEIVRITNYDESEVIENGINYYLNGEDENFTKDDFDGICRSLANAQNYADRDDYYLYASKELRSAIEELGKIEYLDDRGLSIEIDLLDFKTEQEIAEGLDYYEFESTSDLFEEWVSADNIDLPKFELDDRYSAYGDTKVFNDYLSDSDLETYKKGGKLKTKNTIKNNKIKTMNSLNSEFKGGGKVGAITKTKIVITENKEENKIQATRTLVKENSEGEKITYELLVGKHTDKESKPNRYADGWFEIYATDEDDNEYFYAEGGLWFDGNRVVDYDGVYELSEKLRPLMSALNLNTQDVYAEGGELKRKRRKKRQPKVTRIQFEEGSYEYAEGGMTKHGLREFDKISFEKNGKLYVENRDDIYEIDLNKGTRKKLSQNKPKFKKGDSVEVTDKSEVMENAVGFFQEYDFKNQEKNTAKVGDVGEVIGFEQNKYRDGWRTYYVIRNNNSSKEFVIEEKGLKKSSQIFAEGGNVDERLKDWYIENYPTDELGVEMYDDASFDDLWKGILNGEDVYEIMGVGDSIVRERLFEHLAELHGVEYGHIYDIWLESDKYANGGGVESLSFEQLKKHVIEKSRGGHYIKETGEGQSPYYEMGTNSKGDTTFGGKYRITDNEILWTYRDKNGNDYESSEMPQPFEMPTNDKVIKNSSGINQKKYRDYRYSKGYSRGWDYIDKVKPSKKYIIDLILDDNDEKRQLYYETNDSTEILKYVEKLKKEAKNLQSSFDSIEVRDAIEGDYRRILRVNYDNGKWSKIDIYRTMSSLLLQDILITYGFEPQKANIDDYDVDFYDDINEFTFYHKKGWVGLVIDDTAIVYSNEYSGEIETENPEMLEDFLINLFEKKYEGGGEVSVYNLRKGDKIKTRKGNIETIERKIESGYFTQESEYSHPFESIEFIERPNRRMSKGGEAREFKYLYVKQVPNGLKLELTDEGINGYKDEEIYEMYDLFEDVQANSEMTYIDNAGDMGFGLTEAPIITDGYFYDDNGDLTDDGNTDSKVYVWNDYMLKDLFQTLMEQGSVVLTEVKSEGGEADDDDDDDDDDNDDYAGGGQAGKYSIIVWETEEDRDAGESFVAEVLTNRKEALEKATNMFYRQGFSAIEVVDENDNLIIHLSSDDDDEDDDDYAGGGDVNNKIKIKGFPPISKEEALLMKEDFEQNFSSNIEKYTKHLNRLHNSKLRVIDIKEVIDFANTYAGGGQLGSTKQLLKKYESEKPTIALYVIARDVAEEKMRKKFDENIVWENLSDKEKVDYNKQYTINLNAFEDYLVKTYLKMYYNNQLPPLHYKGESRAVMNSIAKSMKMFDYPEDKYAEGGEVLEWMYDALDSLIAETGFTDLEITIVADNGNEFYAEGNGTEYRVFKTEDDAQVQAEEQVLDDLKENPEYFNRNWLMNYIDGRAYFETVLNEMNYNYVEDLKSDTGGNYENDLIEQLVINGLMDEDDARSSQAEELAEERIDDLVNLLTENQLDEGNDGLDYLIDNYGEEEAFEMIVENNLIDTDSATKNAVYIDGIAHFLSSYDGETLYLPNEYVAYRVN